MSEIRSEQVPFWSRPVVGVVVTWLWAIAGPLLLAAVVVGVLRIDLRTARQWWSRNQYLQVYVEAVFVGLLPLGLTLWRGGSIRDYGLHRLKIVPSLSLSLALAVAFWLYAFFTTGTWIDPTALPFVRFPWNVWYALLGIVANGPLEVFFVFWLVRQTDQVLAAEDRRFSRGLLLTILLLAFFHVISTQSVANALTVAGIFLLLGLIFKYTGNACGPMVGWTLINGMTWAYLGLLRH